MQKYKIELLQNSSCLKTRNFLNMLGIFFHKKAKVL